MRAELSYGQGPAVRRGGIFVTPLAHAIQKRVTTLKG